MPRVLDYPHVLDTLTARGLVCLYHNSGAFGFPDDTPTQSQGWILRDDPTLRPAAKEIAHTVNGTATTLATMAADLWTQKLPGDSAWLMPKSHWAYELTFGSAGWLPAALAAVGIDPRQLIDRHDGAAIEFTPADRPAFEQLVETLLRQLAGSDFQITFSGATTICTVHHHQQIWWTTKQPDLW